MSEKVVPVKASGKKFEELRKTMASMNKTFAEEVILAARNQGFVVDVRVDIQPTGQISKSRRKANVSKCI